MSTDDGVTYVEHRIKLEGVGTAIDYEDFCLCDCLHQPNSLLILCAEKVVYDCHLLRRLKYIPQPLMSILISTALFQNRLPSIKYLLDNWPSESFKLEMPPSLKTWEIFHLQKTCEEFKRVVGKFCSSVFGVARHISNWVKHGVNKPLCYLDLGEFPVSDSLVEKMCIAASRRKANRSAKRKIEEHGYTIRMICTLIKKSTVALMISLFQESSTMERPDLKLVLHGLHICSDVFEKQLFHLLEIIDPNELKVLSCERCYLPSNPNMAYHLFACIKQYHYLEGLDLSYTGLDCLRFPNMALDLSHVLRSLTHLKRLDMSHCKLKNTLEFLLEGLYTEERCRPCCSKVNLESRGKLLHLALSDCSLSTDDLSYLSKSMHAGTLVYLKLSGNKLPTKYALKLFKACKEVKVLELEGCVFQTDAAESIFNAFASMPKLRFLNINEVNITEELSHFIGTKFINIPHLQILVVNNNSSLDAEHPTRSLCGRYQLVTDYYTTFRACVKCRPPLDF